MSDVKELHSAPPVEDDDDESTPDGVTRHGDRTSTIKLIWPVEHARQSYEEITVRPLTGADIIRTDKAKGDGERAIMMISVVGRIPMGAARKLEAIDIERVSDEIDFLKSA